MGDQNPIFILEDKMSQEMLQPIPGYSDIGGFKTYVW